LALPEITKKQIERILTVYCSERLPVYLHDEMRLGFRFRGNNVTLYKERPAFAEPKMREESLAAQFRFNPRTKEWVLYWADRNSRWHSYELIEPSRNFETLIKEVHEDPTGIFWS
jgi:hypothetical protein